MCQRISFAQSGTWCLLPTLFRDIDRTKTLSKGPFDKEHGGQSSIVRTRHECVAHEIKRYLELEWFSSAIFAQRSRSRSISRNLNAMVDIYIAGAIIPSVIRAFRGYSVTPHKSRSESPRGNVTSKTGSSRNFLHRPPRTFLSDCGKRFVFFFLLNARREFGSKEE